MLKSPINFLCNSAGYYFRNIPPCFNLPCKRRCQESYFFASKLGLNNPHHGTNIIEPHHWSFVLSADWHQQFVQRLPFKVDFVSVRFKVEAIEFNIEGNSTIGVIFSAVKMTTALALFWQGFLVGIGIHHTTIQCSSYKKPVSRHFLDTLLTQPVLTTFRPAPFHTRV